MDHESMERPCPELPVDVLVLIFARVFSPADRARFHAVSRSWRSAVSPPPRQLPWIMTPDGGFLNPSDRVLRCLVSFPETTSCSTRGERYHRSRFSFNDNTRCVGSTDGWIAVDCQHAENRHRYLLHNEFSGTTLPLPELDAAIGHVSELFEIHKMLLRSTPDDVIAIMTNHPSCPIILARRGKGVWLPKWRAEPLTIIIDVAFLGDRLYGITGDDESLVFLDIALDDNGVPMFTGGKCVIGREFHLWSNEEDYYDDDDGDNDNAGDDDDNPDYDEDDGNSDSQDEYKNDDVVAASDDDDHRDQGEDDDSSDCEDEHKSNDDDDHDEMEDNEEQMYDLTKMTEEDTIGRGIKFIYDDESPHDIQTMSYLIESCGKLIMVRRQVLSPDSPDGSFDDVTHKVDVFEADISAGKWVPLTGGLGGQALFISQPFCKSISASCSEEIQEDVIYFIDTDDEFNMRSKIMSAPRNDRDYNTILRGVRPWELTWVFPPELVA